MCHDFFPRHVRVLLFTGTSEVKHEEVETFHAKIIKSDGKNRLGDLNQETHDANDANGSLQKSLELWKMHHYMKQCHVKILESYKI